MVDFTLYTNLDGASPHVLCPHCGYTLDPKEEGIDTLTFDGGKVIDTHCPSCYNKMFITYAERG